MACSCVWAPGTGTQRAVVLVIIAVSYTVAAPMRPALSAVVPAIAGERHLAVANAVLSTIRQVMTFVGPLGVNDWFGEIGVARRHRRSLGQR